MPLALRLTALALASTLAVAAVAAHPSAALVDASLEDAALRYRPGQLIVQFRPGQLEQGAEAALAPLGAKSSRLLRAESRRADGHGDLRLVRLPDHLSVSDAMHLLREHPAVEFAEPNWIYTTQAKGVDPYYEDGRLWGMYGADSPLQQNEFGSGAGTAFAAGKKCKASVIVGIIDEGVMPKHPDTQANIWTNPFEIAGNGIDDDGNGYVDDVNGYDFFNRDSSPFDGVGDDHATHVSGTIGAVGNNATGVAGVCSKVRIISAKFLGPQGGTTDDAVLAIDYITDLKTRHGLNIVATNNSWGGGGFSQALQDAIERANQADILFMAAAGNGNIIGIGQNNDKKPNYPSNYPNDNIIAVAAISKTGAKAGFSNYGLTTVDIGAPGVDVWSTVPVQSGGNVVGGYASYDGTSMATPHVTGAAALYASLHPGSTAAQIKAAILSHAVPTASLAGKTVTGGRLDVSGF
jgi:hypothetical protein